VLTRTNFNIGIVEGGFNRRDKRPRTIEMIVDHDILSKYFKDTDAEELIRWYNRDVLKFFSQRRPVQKEGILLSVN
jgi:hypothetical protein